LTVTVPFRLFPRYRKPSLWELVGTTQIKRRLSRKAHLRAITDPLYRLENAERRAKRKVGYYSAGAKFARFLFRLFR
jgi:hypothetical protein